MIRTILESADHVEKAAKTIGPPKGLHHTLKMRFAEKVHIFLPSWLFVFSHCFHISRLTKMIRTILESADHVEKVAKAIGLSKWLWHTLKMWFAEICKTWQRIDFFPGGSFFHPRMILYTS